MFSRKRSFQSEFSKCKIFIDNTFFGELGSGETLNYQTENNSVSVWARVEWFKSKPRIIELKDGAETEVQVKVGLPIIPLVLWVSFASIQSFYIANIEKELIRWLLVGGVIVPPLIYLIGVKLGKFHFLSLEEKK